MDLRVTLQTLVNRALADTRRQTSKLALLQQQAATGRRLQAPSDDPARAGVLLRNAAQSDHLDAYLDNIRTVRGTLDSSVSAMTEAANLFVTARTTAIDASQASVGPQAREALAQQVDRLLDRLLDLANSQNNGDSLFAGIASRTTPFVVTATDADGRPTQVTYQGDAVRSEVITSSTQVVNPYLPGSAVFQSRQRQTTVYSGNTGAAAGTGTDSATGQGTLQVRHTTTIYAAGSGVQAGASSAANDTVLGPAGAHTLRIVDTSGTGASGTVALDDGAPIPFTNLDTDLRVTSSDGKAVFINMSAITPGFSGSVALTSDGTLSVDGGATTTPITFTANQQVVDSRTGAVTNVATTDVRRTGDESLDYRGSSDAFQTLMTLRDTLRDPTLNDTERSQRISAQIAELDRVRSAILGAVGEQSVQLQGLDSLENHVQDLKITTQKVISELGDVDLSELVVNLQSQQQLLQLSLASISRVLGQSLLDYLH